jgi:hypothetical protein
VAAEIEVVVGVLAVDGIGGPAGWGMSRRWPSRSFSLVRFLSFCFGECSEIWAVGEVVAVVLAIVVAKVPAVDELAAEVPRIVLALVPLSFSP